MLQITIYALLCGIRADSLPDAMCLQFVLLDITVSNIVIYGRASSACY